MKFVAEIGMNHNGNFDLCYELIKQAKYSGADIAKFQLGWRDGKGEINQIDDKVIKNLLSWGNYFDIEIMFSIISDKAFKMIQKYKMDKYKIASRTLIDNFKLAEKIIKENKTTYVSLGMWKKKKLPFAGDLPSVDKSGSVDKKVHRHLLSSDIIIYESLTNLNRLPLLKPFHFYGFPLPFIGLDGSPIRAVGIIN